MKVTPGALRGDSCSKKEKVPATLQSVEIEGRAMSGSEVSLERILVLSLFFLALNKKAAAAVPVIVTARYVPNCNNFFCVDTTPTRKKMYGWTLIWAHYFGEAGLFPAPNLTNLYRQPSMSACE